jgi:hypothetical protein
MSYNNNNKQIKKKPKIHEEQEKAGSILRHLYYLCSVFLKHIHVSNDVQENPTYK